MFFNGYFFYDGINSKRFGVMFANLETEKLRQLCAEYEYSAEYYNSLCKYSVTGRKWADSPLSVETEILSEKPIDAYNAKKIKRWLFNAPDFKKLYNKPPATNKRAANAKRLYIECVFINPQEIRISGNLFGWKCTCLLASPMAVEDSTVKTYTSFTDTVKINVDTDYSGYTYPYIKIVTDNNTADTDISITNITDSNRTMMLTSVTAKTTVYADCRIGSVIDSSDISLYNSLADRRFLRLLPGENELRISGDIESLEISWCNMRYYI